MRIMILNHQSKREGSPQYEVRVAALLQSYTSPGTTIEVHYPEDLGGSEVTAELEPDRAEALLAEDDPLPVPDSLSATPVGSRPLGTRPLAAASDATLVPARAAIADNVSPGWTT